MIRHRLKIRIDPFHCARSNVTLSECNLNCQECVVPYEKRTHLISHKPKETTVVNIKDSDYDILIDRTTKWGNKFKVKEYGRQKAIALYREWILENKGLLNCLPELKGKKLGCHCKPDVCHGDVLADLVKQLCK
jgi:hypothetical protein